MRLSLRKVCNLLIIFTTVLIILIVFYMNWHVSSMPDRFSRTTTFQQYPELRKPIKGSAQVLFVLFIVEVFLIWLSFFINLFLKNSLRSWPTLPLFFNIITRLFFTVIIYFLYIYTWVSIPCEYAYC